jgi:hypothetical protein
MFRGHPDIQAQRNRIGNDLRLKCLETRPAPVFFVPPGPLLAATVQEPLRDVLLDCAAAIEAHRVRGLNFHGAFASAAGDAQHVVLFIQDVHPLSAAQPSLVGEAFTLRYMPAREDPNKLDVFRDRSHPQRKAVEDCPPGAVLVDNRKDARVASAGAILVTRLMQRGVAALSTAGFVTPRRSPASAFPPITTAPARRPT